MNFKKFDKICVLILAIILILQGLLLIFNVNIVQIRLIDLLFGLFWIIFAVDIGAIIGNQYLEK